ncbi:MAG: insulinase family protein [Candidatus Sumerlaeaceae bacterium]|nr:insulinase family protein [Candidatus Sumerlaeaceae bacterium]
MEQVRKIVLSNGVRIVLERIPYVRSASVGLWIEVGSRNEVERENGISHFIEHMFFKGTRTKNAFQLSNEMNFIGGNVNAFTTQENICLSAKVVDEHLSRAIDLLAEIYLESLFDEEEIKRERNVVLEEVKMYNDTPDELVVDSFMSHLYADHPLGRPILGPPSNIEKFQRQDIQSYLNREFAPDRLVISIAGNFDLRRVEPQLRRVFEPIKPNGWERNPLTHPTASYSSFNEDRNLEQVHFCMGTDGPKRTSSDRIAFGIMDTILGGGTSSRIFQEVREKRGLAYSIGSFDMSFKDSGCFVITGGASPANIQEVVGLCLDEVKRLYTDGVTDEDVESARQQIKSAVLLGMENSASRMSRLAEYEIYFGEYMPVDRVIAEINAVTKDDVLRVAETYLKGRPVTYASIGPASSFRPFAGSLSF